MLSRDRFDALFDKLRNLKKRAKIREQFKGFGRKTQPRGIPARESLW